MRLKSNNGDRKDHFSVTRVVDYSEQAFQNAAVAGQAGLPESIRDFGVGAKADC